MSGGRIERPAYLQSAFSSAFQDADVARAYRYRPPYPSVLFGWLLDLIAAEPRVVLDAGCGRGEIARRLAPSVERVDALDVSSEMIAAGRAEPGGDAPNLRWIVGPAETTPFDPPYALVVGAQSLHWMDWEVVLPRFYQALLPGAYLAVMTVKPLPSPWHDDLGAIMGRYSTNPSYRPYDMIPAWERAGLFTTAGELMAAPEPFAQPLEEYVESFHSISSLSRTRMGPRRAAAFDDEVRALVRPFLEDGLVPMQLQGHLLWGLPHRPHRLFSTRV